MKSKKYLIVGNWKNHPDTLAEARKNFKIIKAKKVNTGRVLPVVCPPTIYLSDLKNSYRGRGIRFGAQNFYLQDEKPHTGETSLTQLKDLGVEFVIVGHAERRALGETNELIAEKLQNALDAKLKPILCIGENERDSGGEYLKFLEEQLAMSLRQIAKDDLKKIVIAYEPVWAIGSNRSVSPDEIHTMNIFIKKTLASLYARKEAFKVPILYGGSVNADNCQEILEGGDIEGLLIGRASANPYSFTDILKKLSA